MTSPSDTGSHNLSYFDDAAATWDDNPHRRKLTEAIAQDICNIVPLAADWRVLEYGCGTGSLSFLLASRVRQVIAADASPGMIEQVRQKLTLHPNVRMTPLLLDLTRDPTPPERFDLIITAMALHHVDDVPLLLTRLGAMLAKGGWLVVADLCKEDGSFHEPRNVPHNGFDPDELARLVAQSLGSPKGNWHLVHRVEKPNRGYDVFLLTARGVQL